MVPGRKVVVAAVLCLVPTLSLTIQVPPHHNQLTDIQPRSHRAKCPGFDGNPDLYGLGIRLGVYSQWFSSWLTNTFNPSAAAGNHDANSIFLLALLIGISVAAVNDAIQPIEAYVMLHVCFGFIFTVLSLLGVRVYFLTPTSLSNFLCSLRVQRESVRGSIRERVQAVQAAFQHLRDWLRSPSPDHHQQEQQNISPEPDPTIGKSTVFSKLVRNLRQVRGASYASSTWVNALTVKFTSDAVSFLKHPSLSWSGVAWRSAILSYLIGLNLWLWWSPGSTTRQPHPPGRVLPAPLRSSSSGTASSRTASSSSSGSSL